MRVALIASAAAAAPVLEAAARRLEPTALWTRPPAPAGRGLPEREAPAAAAARRLGIPVRAPEALGSADAEAIRASGARAVVCFAHGARVPRAVLEAAPLGCVNLHPSLLPALRGAAPVARALLAGARETGWTWIRMDETLDGGPVLAQGRLAVEPRERAPALLERLARAGAEALPGLLAALESGAARPRPQDDARATPAPRLSRGEGRIDWRRPAEALERMPGALDPWPGCWFDSGSPAGRVKVLEARAAPPPAAGPSTPAAPERSAPGPPAAGRSAPPGAVLSLPPELAVACGGGGALVLERVRRAGGRDCSGAELARGARLPAVLPAAPGPDGAPEGPP